MTVPQSVRVRGGEGLAGVDESEEHRSQQQLQPQHLRHLLMCFSSSTPPMAVSRVVEKYPSLKSAEYSVL
jgi:hypothetical protein